QRMLHKRRHSCNMISISVHDALPIYLIEPLDVAYSYGVGRNDDWGCELSRRYHVPVHQYDCFDPARPTCNGGTFVFHNECVGDRDRKSTRLNSSHQITSYAVFCFNKK